MRAAVLIPLRLVLYGCGAICVVALTYFLAKTSFNAVLPKQFVNPTASPLRHYLVVQAETHQSAPQLGWVVSVPVQRTTTNFTLIQIIPPKDLRQLAPQSNAELLRHFLPAGGNLLIFTRAELTQFIEAQGTLQIENKPYRAAEVWKFLDTAKDPTDLLLRQSAVTQSLVVVMVRQPLNTANPIFRDFVKELNFLELKHPSDFQISTYTNN